MTVSADLYYRVAFDAPTQAPDSHGGVEIGWDTDNAVEARAKFLFLRGGETVQAARLEGRQPIVVTIRNSAAARAITTGWRMRENSEGTLDSGGIWTGPAYNVRSGPVPSDDRRFLEFTVEGGVAV
jgi:head-tail adaptor